MRVVFVEMTISPYSEKDGPPTKSDDEKFVLEGISLRDFTMISVEAMLNSKDVHAKNTSVSCDEYGAFETAMPIKVSPASYPYGGEPRIPQIRTLRKVLAHGFAPRVDGRTNPEILVPAFDTHLLEYPLNGGEDSMSGTRQEFYGEPNEVQSTTNPGEPEVPMQDWESQRNSCEPLTNSRTLIGTSIDTSIDTSIYTSIDNSYTMINEQRQNNPSPESISRPRSRSIAIKKLDRCAEELALSQHEITSEKMYDWATWRMYNRIVDHRRNQQKSTTKNSAPMDATQACEYRGVEDMAHTQDSSDYGEVFELDI